KPRCRPPRRSNSIVDCGSADVPLKMTPEGERIYRLEGSGLLHKADFERAQIALSGEIAGAGRGKLLVVLDGFDGWAPEDDWGDMNFYMTEGDAIQRIAIVGDERWRSEMLMFAVADLRKSPVEYFPPGEIDYARAWLNR